MTVTPQTPQIKRRWTALTKAWESCQLCPLGADAFRHVLGRGSLPCQVLFIGEAPGDTEDALGQPFVGRAGRVLDAMIEKAQDLVLTSFTYFITNVIACKPPRVDGSFRKPTDDEAEACSERVRRTVSIADPQAVVLLGKVADKFGEPVCLSQEISYQTLYHPAYLLRKGGIGKTAYNREVLKMVKFLKGVLR